MRWIVEMLFAAISGPVISVIAEIWMPAIREHIALTSGVISSAVVLFCLIRLLNRRDDPRFAKRPPDAP